LKLRGPDGAEREIYLEWFEDEQALMATIYNDTEHAMLVLNRSQTKALIEWLHLQVL
jgi:hypothetical protein